MKPIKNVLIGADIELFLAERATNRIVSAEGLIKGTKYAPYVFDPANKYFSTSLDNVLAEFTVPPTNHVDDWIKNIQKAVGYINSIIPERLCTVARPAAILEPEFLMTENAQTFGCEPDFNVYLKDINPKPQADNPSLRSAGGHIHIGYEGATAETEDGLEQAEGIIQALDLFIGIPSVIQEPDNDRKKLYGKAGAFRFKDYGVEYRTVSNYYLESEKTTRWAFENAMGAVDFLNNGGYEELKSVTSIIEKAINTCDKTLAGNLIRQFNLQMA